MPVLYKSIPFGALVLLFGVVEHLVEGLLHEQGLPGGLREISEMGVYELGARVPMRIFAFVSFFAFWEMGRVLGTRRLAAIFFTKSTAPAGARPPAS